MKMLFTGLGRSVLEETVPSGGTQDLGGPWAQFLPIWMDLPAGE